MECEKSESILVNRDQLNEEIKRIREQLNSGSSIYDNKHDSSAQMQLIIKNNEDGTFEFE